MTEMGTSLDWFRVTMDYGRGELSDYFPTELGGELRERKSMKPYSDAKENKCFSIHWSDNHPEWKVMVEMTGKQLANFREYGGSIAKLFVWAKTHGAKFTRVDYAVDLFDTGGCPNDVLECYHTGQVETIAKSVSIVERTRKNETLGATVYLGSRASERLIRVYDKGKQVKTNLDWIRVEIEVKGKRAMQFGELIEKEGLDTAGKSYIADVVEWSDIPWFESIWKEDYTPIDIDSIGRPETNRERWVREVVIPVLEDELLAGNDWLRNALITLLDDTKDSASHGPNIAPHGAWLLGK